MQDLSGIPLVLREDQLVAPGFRDPSHALHPPSSAQAPSAVLKMRSTSTASPAASALSARARTRPESTADRASFTAAIATGVTQLDRRHTATGPPQNSGAATTHPQTAYGWLG